MFQGLLIATLYCFTNKEVRVIHSANLRRITFQILQVLQQHYNRYRLAHCDADDLRRGSRTASVHYLARQQKNRDSMVQDNSQVKVEVSSVLDSQYILNKIV